MPSAEQLQAYDRDGYLLLRPGYSGSLLAEVRADLSERLQWIRTRLAEQGADRRYRETDSNLHWKNEAVRMLISEDSLLDVATSLVGADVDVRFCFTLTKTAQHGEPILWHQDWGLSPDTGHPLITCWIAVTDADPGNGCLEVLPGSHRRGLLPHEVSEVHPPDKGIPGLDTAGAVPVSMQAGEVLVIHPLLIHGSGKHRSGRERIAVLVGYQAPKPAYDEFWGRAGARFTREGKLSWGPLEWS